MKQLCIYKSICILIVVVLVSLVPLNLQAEQGTGIKLKDRFKVKRSSSTINAESGIDSGQIEEETLFSFAEGI